MPAQDTYTQACANERRCAYAVQFQQYSTALPYAQHTHLLFAVPAQITTNTHVQVHISTEQRYNECRRKMRKAPRDVAGRAISVDVHVNLAVLVHL